MGEVETSDFFNDAIPPKTLAVNERQYSSDSSFYSKVGLLNHSFVSVVKQEGPRRGGVVPVGRWARVAVCKCLFF